MLKKFLVTCAFILLAVATKGQDINYEIPVYFSQYFNDPQVTGAFLTGNESGSLTLGHRRNSNNFGGINTSIFSGTFKSSSDGSKPHHEYGFQAVHDQEGFLISRSRAYATYSYNLKFNSNYYLGGGSSLGFYNFNVKADGSFEGLSKFAFDGAFFIKWYSEKLQLQFNINQFPNSSIQPILQKTVLTRNAGLYGSYKFKIATKTHLTTSFNGNFSKKTTNPFSGFNGKLGTKVLLVDKISTGMSLEFKNGYYFFMGMENINLMKASLDIELSYFVPLPSSNRVNIQLFEIMLKYNFLTKNE